MTGKTKTKPHPQILLYGDSHSEAVFQAAELRERKRKPTPVCIHRARREKGEKVLGDTSLGEFVELSRSLTESDVVISMIGGNQHAVLSTIQQPIAFDVLEPGAGVDTWRQDAQLIPYRMVASILRSGVRGRDGSALKAVREATRAKLIHIISPPPKRDNAFIRSYHETRFKGEIGMLGVSSPELRMKFWRMQRAVTQEFCEELGIEMMNPPSAALDADGFLLPGYYAKDATHANREYGLLLLDELERRFASDAKAAA